MNISSAIVYCQNTPEETQEELKGIQGCEVHLMDEDKRIIILSIEAENIEAEMHILNAISALPSVLEAHLHYSYSEEELEQARANISSEVSPILDDETPIEEVRYSGSVYNQMYKS
ncbi:chaperone NapD [Helicobacter pametensis]|uniref:chaperone NapD n=1 Tax=Helicobacter pametensis TaxID=95149 RepID=UPI0004876EFC|nr:chaperone NapD [Helicobacter pametensis]